MAVLKDCQLIFLGEFSLAKQSHFTQADAPS